MKKILLLITSVIYALLVHFVSVAVTMEEGDLKVPKMPIEEVLELGGVEANRYLSDPNNFNTYSGFKKIYYGATQSPKYFLINFLVSLMLIFGGMMILKSFQRFGNAT